MQEKDQSDRESHIRLPSCHSAGGKSWEHQLVLKATEVGLGHIWMRGSSEVSSDGRGVRLPRLECACLCAVRTKRRGLGCG